MDIDFATSFLLSAILGFMIGLQRELQTFYEKSQEFGGARTFAIISIIGFISAKLNDYNDLIRSTNYLAKDKPVFKIIHSIINFKIIRKLFIAPLIFILSLFGLTSRMTIYCQR